jgi:hypothetical protein
MAKSIRSRARSIPAPGIRHIFVWAATLQLESQKLTCRFQATLFVRRRAGTLAGQAPPGPACRVPEISREDGRTGGTRGENFGVSKRAATFRACAFFVRCLKSRTTKNSRTSRPPVLLCISQVPTTCDQRAGSPRRAAWHDRGTTREFLQAGCGLAAPDVTNPESRLASLLLSYTARCAFVAPRQPGASGRDHRPT